MHFSLYLSLSLKRPEGRPFDRCRLMTDLESILPTSSMGRGAALLDRVALEAFLEGAIECANENGVIGALLLIRVASESGEPLPAEEMEQATYVLAQLTRQAEAMAPVAPDTLGVVVNRLARRADVYVILQRLEDFVAGAQFSWCISTGVAVFPFCGTRGSSAWIAARRDLEGAMSCDTWEHEIPRETIRTRQVG